ncbi:sulfotransferase family 2 domain-containing protein [Aliiglaciecola sp. NS0011-25]|uniref:sulfotransferase family 2 domain-containing protein n=1 Tax=Aliiglaciecola sp. NS0011-25 TaxID=3127654 RepID=UPI003105E428
MLSIEHNFLFLHLPKTAGNSIQERLKAYSEDKIVCINDFQDGIERFEVRNQFAGIHKHSSLTDYQKVLPETLFKHLFIFATIRNPWERMISFYFSPHRKVKLWDRNDFINLLNQVKTLPQLLAVENPSHQQEWFDNVDFIIKYEHLDTDFQKVCLQLELDCNPLTIRNKSSRLDYKTYYDPELIELVAQKFEQEIAYGHYSF